MNLDRVVLITGAGGGLGEAVALLFGEEAATIVTADIAAERAVRVRDLVAREYPKAKAEAVTLDVRNCDAVKTTIRQVVDRFGRLDILINAAGVDGGDLEPKDPYRESVVWGVAQCSQAALLAMRERGSGRIVSFTPALAPHEREAIKASMVRGAVTSFTRHLAAMAAPAGIAVNAIVPGIVDTLRWAEIPQDRKSALLRDVPLGRALSPREVAIAALYLATSEFGGPVTGQVLYVDGGTHLNRE